MQEPNETTQNQLPKPEICSIKIMFPTASDEAALDVKRKIADILKDVEQVRTDFSISSMNR